MARLTLLLAAALATAVALPGIGHAQTLKKIADSKTITVAYRTDSIPFSFEDNKQPTGYTVDICRRVIASIEQQLKISGLQTKWIAATPANRMELVAKRQADMECGATTATLSRMEQVDFSSLTFVDGGGLMVKADAKLNSLADLAGKKVAVIPGTSTERALGAALKARLVNATIVPVKTREDGLAAVEGGTADAYASDRVLLVGLATKSKDPSKLSMMADEFSFEPYAIVLPRGDPDFRLAVNRALAQLYGSGEIEGIFNKWFGVLGRPSVLVAAMFFLGTFPQ